MLKDHPVDLFLLDINMPEMNGWQLLADLQQRGFDEPVIVLSADPYENTSLHQEELNFEAYINKPVRIERLLEQLQRCLNLRWCNTTENDDEAAQQNGVGDTGFIPSPEQLKELERAAKVGYLKGIMESIERFESVAPNSRWRSSVIWMALFDSSTIKKRLFPVMHKIRDKTTVLVVDDSPDSLGMINMALDEAGIAVLIALNGQQALKVLEQITPDVILMDAVMPVMDGFECARQVRQILPLTPIIFMTGLSEIEHIVKAFDVGGNDYIVKPIHPDELLVRIQQHTHSTRMLMEAQKVLDAMQQHVFCIDRRGNVLWATPEAQALLNRHRQQVADDVVLGDYLSRWLPAGQDGHHLALPLKDTKPGLTVCYFKQAGEDEYLLKIQSPNVEIDPSVLEGSLSVTRRETEVLLLLAYGKTNREIAEILGMSPRTVNKHLEQIYPKIGANNRTAAASNPNI